LGSLMYRSILLLLMRHNVATTRILSTLTLLVMRIQFVILLVSLSDGYKVINFFFLSTIIGNSQNYSCTHNWR
jgi:hypothetical protein